MKTSCRATHKGTCQICGSLQMLPSGVLAKHGYTTKWGFFSGVCSGSGHLPFEQSTDAIEAAVASVEAQVKKTEAEIATFEDLSSPVNDGTNVWVRVYADEYMWVRAKLQNFSTDSTTYAPSTISKCCFATLQPVRTRRGTAPVVERVEAYDAAWKMHTLPEWARFLNRKFAATLAKTNESRRSWVKWQNQRVATWAPAPLAPR